MFVVAGGVEVSWQVANRKQTLNHSVFCLERCFGVFAGLCYAFLRIVAGFHLLKKQLLLELLL